MKLHKFVWEAWDKWTKALRIVEAMNRYTDDLTYEVCFEPCQILWQCFSYLEYKRMGWDYD